MTDTAPTAAVLLIGDEILSGRTKDKNLGYIADFLTAYRRGCKLFHDTLNRKDAAAAERGPLLDIIARYTQQKPEDVAATLAYVEPDGKLDLPNVAHQIEWYQSLGYVDRGFGLEQILDRRFVRD